MCHCHLDTSFQNLSHENMNTRLEINRLIGQKLCSVLTAIDHISLKFVKYPLSATGEFKDGALIDIEEGYSVTYPRKSTSVRSAEGLDNFRKQSLELIKLIEATITEVEISQDGELELKFDSDATLRLLKSEIGFDSFGVTFDA